MSKGKHDIKMTRKYPSLEAKYNEIKSWLKTLTQYFESKFISEKLPLGQAYL